MSGTSNHVEVLLVEDNPGDVRLIREALNESTLFPTILHVVSDGVDAMRFLERRGAYAGAPRPDFILLDLNLPKKDGREVLAEMKASPDLQTIPVFILTSSDPEEDLLRRHSLDRACYAKKPIDLDRYFEVIRRIEHTWIRMAGVRM
jgi:chemotaxis family two-component system response regulator Rcp1